MLPGHLCFPLSLNRTQNSAATQGRRWLTCNFVFFPLLILPSFGLFPLELQALL